MNIIRRRILRFGGLLAAMPAVATFLLAQGFGEFVGTVTDPSGAVIIGRHSLSFGGLAELSRVGAVASYVLGRITSFRQGAGEFKNNRNQFIGFYGQDSFRVSNRLTLNYGLRLGAGFPVARDPKPRGAV